MSNGRKICLYKNCEREPGHTLFKFPVEKERFTTWCVNSGVILHGEVDITEPRYLCEQHFSAKYINKQSRRKMLVHTAVPRKWSAEINEEPQFTIVGSQPGRKRKFSNITPDITLNETNLNQEQSTTPPVIENVARRSSSRLLEISSVSSVEAGELAGEFIETQEVDEQIEEPPIKTLKSEAAPVNYEEVVVMEQPRRRNNVQYIVVKPKPKVVSNAPRLLNTIHVLNSQIQSGKKIYENYEQLETEETEEIGDISSTNVESFESPEKSSKESTKSDALENYSEFIFNGEKYVQMPKRVFEAEKEKVRKEAERCKQLLRKLKHHLNNMDLD